jgi:hypothetical protein
LSKEEKNKGRNKRKARPGKPTLDSYLEPEDLPDRIIDYCKLVAKNIAPITAGALVNPPAGEQQVERWEKDCPAVKKAVALYRIEEDQIQQNYPEQVKNKLRELGEVVLQRAIDNVKEGKVPWKDLREMMREYVLMEGVLPPIMAETLEAEEELTTTELMDRAGLLDRDKKLLNRDSSIAKLITTERRTVRKKRERK